MKKIILLLIVGLLGFGCSDRKEMEIKAPGIVDGNIITLKSQVSGTIDELHLEEGQTVTRGDVIVRINSDKIKNQYNELEITLKEIKNNSEKLKKKAIFIQSNLAHLDKQVKRFQRLKKTNSISGEKLETMELRKLEAETLMFETNKSLRALELQKEKIDNKRDYLNLLMEDYVIKSPCNRGIIIETFIAKGETVFPGASIADILDISSIFIETFLEEQEITLLKLNQRVRILVDGLGEKELWGTVSYFGRKAEFSPKYIISEKERKSLLYQVKVKVKDDAGIFKIGMPTTVVFGVVD